MKEWLKYTVVAIAVLISVAFLAPLMSFIPASVAFGGITLAQVVSAVIGLFAGFWLAKTLKV